MKNPYRIHIYIADRENDIINALGRERTSEVVRIALNQLYNQPYSVFSITNKVNDRVFLGLTPSEEYFTKDMLLNILKNPNDLIKSDFEEYGVKSFRVELLGGFGSKSDANKFITYKLNEIMDEGQFVYNEEVYRGDLPRFIKIPISFKILNYLIDHLYEKKTTIVKLVTKLLIAYMKSRKIVK